MNTAEDDDDRLVAVVTGANRGIGKAIVRQLLLQSQRPLIVYLTARNIAKGQKAMEEVRREQQQTQNEVRFHQLDVSNTDSIQTFIDYLTLMHGFQSVDILINNAGGLVRHRVKDILEIVRTCDLRTADQIVNMNYFTAVNATSLLLPHMRPGARVIFMATALAQLGIFSGDLPKVLSSDDLTLNGLNIIENGFVSAVGMGNYSSYGFPPMPFAVAKAGIIAYSRMLARIFANDPRGLLFAAACPGFVKTAAESAESGYAPLTPDQGAETPVYLALSESKRIRRHNGELWKRLRPLKW